MRNLDEVRRLNGALQEQMRINEEVAEQSKSDAKPGEAKWAVLLLLAVVFLKPVAEYCIDLYKTAAGYVHGLADMIGL